jgi:hypothetical protein
VITVAIAVAGPLPATGFADHPLASLSRSVAEQIGVREAASSPPIGEEPPIVIEGREVTIEEATALLGAYVRVPPAPEGFTLASSRYFDTGISSGSGTYALTYTGPNNGTLAVFQERAPNIAVLDATNDAPPARPQDLVGPAADDAAPIAVTLEDGTPAAYIRGAWQPSPDGATLTWDPIAGRSLMFDRAGLRTTIQYTGPEDNAPSLFALADSFTPAE